ncbi:MAG: M48 family metalloprotease [Pyrinomonadaceae bacterium]|nr:M48 family metalloprotease [Pyrinomonadaceae bacterium]
MIESLFEIGISNAVISLAIAAAAVLVGRFTNRPHLAHLLWLLVLMKLLVPAIIPISYDLAPETVTNVPAAVIPIEKSAGFGPAPTVSRVEEYSVGFSEVFVKVKSIGQTYLPIIWGLGILLALGWSVLRVIRFDRLLRQSSERAPDCLYEMSGEIAKQLSLKKLPSIKVTNAEISPLVWWLGGEIKIFLSSALVSNMKPAQMRLVLAHELAHVKRRDFVVRWIEWSAAILFWWNPVVWWAQRNLRANEEICCDALVLSTLKPEPKEYASSLLSAVEEFVQPAFRPPAMASEVNSGGYLVRRINMILSGNNKQNLSRKLRIAVIAAAAVVLPLGLTFAQDKEPEIEKRVGEIKKGVEAGKISKEEAESKISELKREFQIRIARKKLDAAVKEGRISEEDAEKKLEAIKKNQRSQPHRSDEIKRAVEKIESALKEGKISKEEAEARMLEFRLHQSLTERRMKIQQEAEKLQAGVKSDNISREEAGAKMRELERSMATAQMKMNHQLAAEKLELALKAGRISQQEAQVKMEELKRRLVVTGKADDMRRIQEQLERAVRANKISREDAETKMKALQLRMAETESKSRIKDAARRLEMELKAGRISKTEAAEHLRRLKHQHNAEQRMIELRRAQEKLEALVKSGKMTEGEARKKLAELEKKSEPKKDN